MKLPSYLRITRHNVYVFRRRIPKDLKSVFYTNEIRISLRLKHKKEAVTKAQSLALQCEKLFNFLRSELFMSDEIEKDSEKFKTFLKYATDMNRKTILLEEARELENDLRRQIFLERKKHNEQLKEVISPKGKQILLSEMIAHFFEESELARRGDSIATIRKDKEAINLFFDFVGEKEVSDINQQDAAQFAKMITTFKTKRATPRAPATANKYLNSISKFSGWITAFHSDTKHIKLDFSRFKYKTKLQPSESRDAFTDTEVIRILQHPDFIRLKIDDPSAYWIIYVAAYSGARLEEIAQLDPVNDIYLSESVWVFDINDLKNKSLKNSSSKRLVPVHSQLLKVGLLEYLDELKKVESSSFALNEKIRDGRVGKNVGKRVSRLIQNKIGISNKSLHSFRHTFVTKLKRLGVQEGIAAAIVGHESGKITYNRYGKKYLISQIKDYVEKVEFEETQN